MRLVSYILCVTMESKQPHASGNPKRPWKGVLFPCCGVYGRMYQSAATGRFEGNCPRCGQPAKLGLWSLVACLLLLLPLLAAPTVWAADLGSIDTATPAPTQTQSPVIRQGLTAINEPDSTPAAQPLPDSLLRAPQPKAADTTSLMGKKTVLIDSVRLSLFIQSGVSFLGFEDRDRFAQALDTMYLDYLGEALNPKDSARVKKQSFQNVNFCFPVYAGLEVMLAQGHHIALGAGYIYDKETVVLTDRLSRPHEVYYVLQAIPLFVEWRIGITPRLITLDGHERFSAMIRYWWLLSGTEIYSAWGTAKANTNVYGSGWGLALGYQLLEWKRIRIYGDLGFAVLRATSDDPWSQVVPDYSETKSAKAKWELGGIQLNLRANLGILKK